MMDLLTFENIANLGVLIFLQAVLGFDNLLYISIESQRAPKEVQKQVRFWGIIIAVALRIVLLFTMIQLIDAMAEPFFIMNWEGVLEGAVDGLADGAGGDAPAAAQLAGPARQSLVRLARIPWLDRENHQLYPRRPGRGGAVTGAGGSGLGRSWGRHSFGMAW